MAATPAWLGAIEALLNRGIHGSAQAGALAHDLDSRSLRMDVTGLSPITAFIVGGRLALISGDSPADATISGSPLALLHLMRNASVRGSTSGAVQIRGDAEIANQFRQLLALARPELEDELARVVGDLPARRLSLLTSRTIDWLRRTRRTAGENIVEYLQEESRDLVNRFELDEFLRGVDELRETADRIEARLGRLEQRFEGPT